jgi:uncharacterized protein YlzI (FlbEa/FlbD family)
MKPLVILTSENRRCAVNGLQIETIEERHNGAEITFASGTTLFVREGIDEIVALFRARPRREIAEEHSRDARSR